MYENTVNNFLPIIIATPFGFLTFERFSISFRSDIKHIEVIAMVKYEPPPARPVIVTTVDDWNTGLLWGPWALAQFLLLIGFFVTFMIKNQCSR